MPAISAAAQREFDAAVETLRGAGVTVHVVDDTATPEKPDAVFPNNWFSTHHDGASRFTRCILRRAGASGATT
jgi:hypothetical protein